MVSAVCYLGIDRLTPREVTRLDVAFQTLLRADSRPDREVTIRNLSSRGFMALVEDPPLIGESGMLFLPGIGWRSIAVRWRLGGRFGGCFVEPISMDDFWRANPPFDPQDARLPLTP